MAPCQGHSSLCGDVPKDVPNRPFLELSYWKGAHARDTAYGLEFPPMCEFCVSSSYIEFIDEKNLQIEVCSNSPQLTGLRDDILLWFGNSRTSCFGS